MPVKRNFKSEFWTLNTRMSLKVAQTVQEFKSIKSEALTERLSDENPKNSADFSCK